MEQLFKDTVKVSIDDIVPDPNNPNKMTKEQAKSLVYSMKKFDDVMPIVVDSKTMMVADGHHRLEAYKTMGVKQINVIKKDFKTPEERILFAQTMNKLRGEHDKKLDVDVVYSLVNGSEETLLEYMRLVAIEDERTVVQYLQKSYPDYTTGLVKQEDEERLAEIVNFHTHGTEPPITQTGDLWKMGPHRLLCGDALKQRDVNVLFDSGCTPDLVLTDPPYNIGFKYNMYDDELDEDAYRDFCHKWFKMALMVANGNVIFTPGPRNISIYAFIREPDDVGVWYKPNAMSSASFFHLRLCEPVLFYGSPPKNKRVNDFFEFARTGMRELDEVRKEAGNEHDSIAPSKPVPLLSEILTSYSKHGSIVFDPFMGTGSTLISCEQVKRISYGMEIDPRYCDVIVKRWEEFTGQKAEKVGVQLEQDA